jgi:hypothetical protein
MSENINIIRIQRYWREKKIKKSLKILNLNKNITINVSFDNFTLFIQKKKTLALVNYFLKKFHKLVDYKNEFIDNHINSRELLSAFLIYGYKDLVIGNEKTLVSNTNNLIQIENSVVLVANDLVRLFTLMNFSNINNFLIDSLYNKMFEFKFIFNTWKYGDRKQILQILTHSYHEFENNKKIILNNKNFNDILDHEKLLINKYNKLQINILKKIKFLNGQKIFQNYKPIKIDLDDKFKDHFKSVFEKAYWDILINELKSTPKKYNQLVNILNEIRNLFCSLVPSRKDLHIEFHENIDTDLIKQMAENNALDGLTVYNIVNYIINLILKLQPPDMDEATLIWRNNVNKSFEEGFEYHIFLPIFFQNTFQKINLIKNYIDKFKKSKVTKQI